MAALGKGLSLIRAKRERMAERSEGLVQMVKVVTPVNVSSRSQEDIL